MARDRRRVQTAVTGGPDGTIPVVLPVEEEHARLVVREHEDDFWCGRYLGGCGAPLIVHLSGRMVCHFAHHPGVKAAGCRRPGRVTEADPLVIGTELAAWLADQGHAAAPAYTTAGAGQVPDGLVLEPAGRGCLRAWLTPDAPVDHSTAGEQLLLAPHVPYDREARLRRGYTLRVRAVQDGPWRRVEVGTETTSGTTWAPLGECTLTDTGLATPRSIEPDRARTSTHAIGTASVSRRAGSESSTRPVAIPVVDDHAELVTELQQAWQAVVTTAHPGTGTVNRLRRALARVEDRVHSMTADEAELVHQASEALRNAEQPVTPPPPRRLERRKGRRHPGATAFEARNAAREIRSLLEQLAEPDLSVSKQRRLIEKATRLETTARQHLTVGERCDLAEWRQGKHPAFRATRVSADAERPGRPGEQDGEGLVPDQDSAEPIVPRPVSQRNRVRADSVGRSAGGGAKSARSSDTRRAKTSEPRADRARVTKPRKAKAPAKCADCSQPFRKGQWTRRVDGRLLHLPGECEPAGPPPVRQGEAKAAPGEDDQSVSMVPEFMKYEVTCPVCLARPDEECHMPAGGTHTVRVTIYRRRRR